MIKWLSREAVHLWYYLDIQIRQIAPYWALGIVLGSAAAFMITGPATKITNLGAMKIVLGWKRFLLYIMYVILFSWIIGMIVNLVC